MPSRTPGVRGRGALVVRSCDPPLQPTATATCIRVRDQKTVVTDGPYAETHEQLAGYFLIDAKSLDEAIGIAAKVPGAKIGTIEIRPIREVPGLPAAS